jgi:hypothetical protein
MPGLVAEFERTALAAVPAATKDFTWSDADAQE